MCTWWRAPPHSAAASRPAVTAVLAGILCSGLLISSNVISNPAFYNPWLVIGQIGKWEASARNGMAFLKKFLLRLIDLALIFLLILVKTGPINDNNIGTN